MLLDCAGREEVGLAVVDEADRAEELLHGLGEVLQVDGIALVERDGDVRVDPDFLAAEEAADLEYLAEEGELPALRVPFRPDPAEEGGALGCQQQVVVEHLLDGQVAEVLLAELHPLLVVAATLNALGDAEDGHLVLGLLAVLLEVGEVLGELVGVALVGPHRNELRVNALPLALETKAALLHQLLALEVVP